MTATTSDRRVDPVDLLDVDAHLDDDERMLRDTVRRFVRERVLPEIHEWFDAGILPREVITELAELGLLGMHLDGYGCGGSTATMYGVVCRELEAADSGLRSAVSVQGSLAMYAIHRFGSEEQKTTWLPAMAGGEAVGCFGLTEADSGSDPNSMRTAARRDGGDWVLQGSKGAVLSRYNPYRLQPHNLPGTVWGHRLRCFRHVHGAMACGSRHNPRFAAFASASSFTNCPVGSSSTSLLSHQ
jgi:hypothetical protein